ncbi:DUF2188 domain-containing protein [Lysobacter enzymogenes]|uniref:DUF2188 domain-containing protein n=1 Tax=Lysobacter enzymogenes TaxID=69 RepID=UPI001A9651A8|nr:DUF2188 domain-containing protein [Lysobacter enzymogenes]QQP95415.1 DUF2188 domain-containing protein [Lysobacter enzymogenes]
MSTSMTIYEVVPHASSFWRLRINGAHEIAFPNRDIARAAARVRARRHNQDTGGHAEVWVARRDGRMDREAVFVGGATGALCAEWRRQ